MSTYFPRRRRVPGRTAPGILAGAATAIGAGGLLTVAVPAQPAPRFPLAPAQPVPAPSKVATVKGDVDVYDVAGGNGNILGILRDGGQVQLAGSCKPNDWCNVTGPAVPTGKGWVWGHVEF